MLNRPTFGGHISLGAAPFRIVLIVRQIRSVGLPSEPPDYQAKSKTMSRGMPAALTLAMSAASASVIDACSAEYFCANSKSPVA